MAIRDAPAHEQETDWVEWKGDVDLAEKQWKAEIARQVIGFANRHPDRARRECAGCAYLVIGATPGSVRGVSPIDAAKLENGVSVYIGRDGPQWSPDYVDVDGCTVLVITVEPPEWGDRIYVFEKEFESFKSGDAFVRRSGNVEKANAQEMRMLSARAAEGETRLAVDLDWWEDEVQVTPIDLSEQAVSAWVESERRAFYDELPFGASTVSSAATLAKLGLLESRSASEYREQVDSYLETAGQLAPAIMKHDAVHDGSNAVSLAAINLTAHNFTGVEFVLSFEGAVWAYFERSDAWGEDFPRRPKPWGVMERYSISDSLRLAGATPPERRGFARNHGSTEIRFSAVDMRAEYKYSLGPVHLLVSAEHAGETLQGEWHATATSHSGLARGTFDVAVATAST